MKGRVFVIFSANQLDLRPCTKHKEMYAIHRISRMWNIPFKPAQSGCSLGYCFLSHWLRVRSDRVSIAERFWHCTLLHFSLTAENETSCCLFGCNQSISMRIISLLFLLCLRMSQTQSMFYYCGLQLVWSKSVHITTLTRYRFVGVFHAIAPSANLQEALILSRFLSLSFFVVLACSTPIEFTISNILIEKYIKYWKHFSQRRGIRVHFFRTAKSLQ